MTRASLASRLAAFQAAKAEGRKLAVLTAYDYPTARLLDEAGVDAILVGDSLGMVVLGYPDTTLVTLDEMAHHVRAASRGVSRALVIGDLSVHTYDTPGQAVASAQRLVAAGADVVKLEGGQECAPQIRAITEVGIRVVGHIGMLPQHVREEGGYKIKGKTREDADRLIADGLAVEEAGAIGVIMELVRPEVSAEITAALTIPTIGIGAGPGCDGQVLVTHDLIGMFPWFTPKFITPATHTGVAIREAAQEFTRRIHAGEIVK